MARRSALVAGNAIRIMRRDGPPHLVRTNVAHTAKRGWHKSPMQTPSEFVTSIEDPAMRERVALFTRRYESARFGDSRKTQAAFRELYVEID